MIPADCITEWRERTRWATDEQVEQDLVLSRALGQGARLVYRFESETPPVVRLELEIEIETNTREHFSVYGMR